MNIPDKFTFFNQNRTLKLTNINGDFYCTLPEVDADTISSAVYDRRNVEHKLASGQWKIVADLTVAEKEPEMKFPFTFYYNIDPYVSYTVSRKDGDKLITNLTNKQYHEQDWKMDQALVSKYIKEGIYVVTSVGEQEVKEEIVEPVPEYGESDSEEILIQADNGNWKIFKDGRIQAESMKIGSLSSLCTDTTIKLEIANFDEEFAKLTSYKEKVEKTIEAVERLNELLEGLGVGGCVVQTFCCGED